MFSVNSDCRGAVHPALDKTDFGAVITAEFDYCQ